MNKILTYILTSAIVFTLLLGGYKFFISITHPVKYESIIVEMSNKYDLSPSLIASLINVESSYDANAKSNKNAIGLTQIKLSTANYINEINNENIINEEKLFIPKINIKYGCIYLKYLINKFENINTALASYNAGETRVRSWLNDKNYSPDGKTLKNIPYAETKNYVEKIEKNLHFYKKIYKT